MENLQTGRNTHYPGFAISRRTVPVASSQQEPNPCTQLRAAALRNLGTPHPYHPEPVSCHQHPNHPPPTISSHLMREISVKRWTEAQRWAGAGTSKTKYRMPKSQRPEGVVAGSTKSLASRYYQLKTGAARTGQYPHWAKARPTAQCWWCQSPSQT